MSELYVKGGLIRLIVQLISTKCIRMTEALTKSISEELKVMMGSRSLEERAVGINIVHKLVETVQVPFDSDSFNVSLIGAHSSRGFDCFFVLFNGLREKGNQDSHKELRDRLWSD